MLHNLDGMQYVEKVIQGLFTQGGRDILWIQRAMEYGAQQVEMHTESPLSVKVSGKPEGRAKNDGESECCAIFC